MNVKNTARVVDVTEVKQVMAGYLKELGYACA